MGQTAFPSKASLSFMQKRLNTDYDIGRQIGINLRHYRRLKHLSQTDLAEKCNLTTYIISNIESKPYYGVKVKTLKDIADALEINICDLICSLH